MNLQDVDKSLLRRGQCAAAPGSLSPTLRMDARLRLLRGAGELKMRDRVRLHIGTDELIARVVLLEAEKLSPGESALVQFVLESPGVALPGDRFIVRRFSPVLTIGGGEILDPAPDRHKRFESAAIEGIRRFEGSLEAQVEQIFRKSPHRTLTPGEAAILLGKRASIIKEAVGRLAESGRLVKIPAEKEDRFLPVDAWAALQEKTFVILKKYFSANPHRPSMPVADLKSQLEREADEPAMSFVIDELIAQKALVPLDSGLALPGHEARIQPKEQELADRVEGLYRKAGFEPPLDEDVVRQLHLPLNDFRKVLGILLKEGQLVRLDPRIIYHCESFERAKSLLVDFLRVRREITIADAKVVLRVSRKFACAVLEHLDRIHMTCRKGDVHVLK